MAKEIYKITVVGIGYVGLSVAILLAQNNDVKAFDISTEKVDSLNKKICPIEDSVAQKYLNTKQLSLIATTDEAIAFKKADFIVIALPTNFDEKKNCFDTSLIEKVISNIKKYNTTATIVIKSTIGIGYTYIVRKKTGYNNIIFSPEFLREGKSLYDNLYPSRIIVGVDQADEVLLKQGTVFAALLRDATPDKNAKTIIMGIKEAEAVKLFSNSYLAMRVAFFNELDSFAETHDLNTRDIINGVCTEPRIGGNYNNPSFGYGGYCLPKDTKQLRHDFGDLQVSIIGSIVDANAQRKKYVSEMAFRRAKDASGDKTPVIGVHRLIMKAGSDNFRESAIQSVMQQLSEKGACIVIYEPTISGKFNGFSVIDNFNEFKKISDLIIANRFSDELLDVAEKVYCRDIFMRD